MIITIFSTKQQIKPPHPPSAKHLDAKQMLSLGSVSRVLFVRLYVRLGLNCGCRYWSLLSFISEWRNDQDDQKSIRGFGSTCSFEFNLASTSSSCGREKGRKIETQTALKTRGGDGGLRATCFQARSETRRISGAGGGGSHLVPEEPWPPLAAGCSAPAQAPRCYRRPWREGQGSTEALRWVFLQIM